MKKISEIYCEYKIMPNLQEHMFRVAAVASTICDNFDEVLPKKEIVSACLLHDLGNIVKFNLELTQRLFPEFVEEKDLEYWQNVQKEFIAKYGKNDHLATFAIFKELQITGKVFDLVENITSKLSEDRKVGSGFDVNICKYADFRVGPKGVLELRERINEWKARDQRVNPEFAKQAYEIFSQIESQIFSKCKIKPEDITDKAIVPIILELKNFVIE